MMAHVRYIIQYIYTNTILISKICTFKYVSNFHYSTCMVKWSFLTGSSLNIIFHYQGIFYAIVLSGLRVLRVCYGPLPIFLCNIYGFLNGFALLFAAITVLMNILTRFMFVCIWKRMRQMDDNLIVRIATIQAIIMTLLFEAASWSGSPFQGQPPVSYFCFCVLSSKVEKF